MNRATNTAVRLAANCFEPAGPVVEIGSFYVPDRAAMSDLRPYFRGREFIGCDIRPGPGVDRIEDAHQLTFADDSIGTVLMLHLLEHLPEPTRAVAEAHRVLRENGLLVVCVPFSYRLHGLPSDYWRFTSAGVAALLEPFGARTVFALGPRLKPTIIFGVAAKRASPTFEHQSQCFKAAVTSTYKASRLRGYWREVDERARDFLGCLLGRAELSTAFFEKV